MKRILPVFGGDDIVPQLAEPALDEVPGVIVVFSQQDAHRPVVQSLAFSGSNLFSTILPVTESTPISWIRWPCRMSNE